MEQIKENRLGTEPIGKLLLKMSLPMMISMLVLALYNIVDTIFVSHLNDGEAVSALANAFPFQMLISSIAVGTSVGVSSLISRRLGEKRQDAADNAATTGILLMIISGIVVSCIYFFCSRLVMVPFATSEVELNYAASYLHICGSLSLFIMIGVCTEKIIQGTGDAIRPMIIQLAGALTNIALDPILIFGYFGMPKMGVSGAAVATVAGQVVSMILGLCFLLVSKHKKVHISFRHFKLHGKVIKDIYDVGLPSIIMQSIASFVTMGIYLIINAYIFEAEKARSVLGIYFKIQSFVFMPVFGLNSGSLPIMAYNYGARNKARFIRTLKLSLIWALAIMCFGLLIFQIIPGVLIKMFPAVGNDTEALQMGMRAFRIISICFPFAAFGIILVGAFNAVGKGIFALFVSGARQCVVILPAAFLLARFIDFPNNTATAIWWAYPMAEAMGLILASLLFARVYTVYLKPLDIPLDDGTDSEEL